MFILKHGTREDKPFLMSVVIGVTGLDISCSEEKKAMRFIFGRPPYRSARH